MTMDATEFQRIVDTLVCAVTTGKVDDDTWDRARDALWSMERDDRDAAFRVIAEAQDAKRASERPRWTRDDRNDQRASA